MPFGIGAHHFFQPSLGHGLAWSQPNWRGAGEMMSYGPSRFGKHSIASATVPPNHRVSILLPLVAPQPSLEEFQGLSQLVCGH